MRGGQSILPADDDCCPRKDTVDAATSGIKFAVRKTRPTPAYIVFRLFRWLNNDLDLQGGFRPGHDKRLDQFSGTGCKLDSKRQFNGLQLGRRARVHIHRCIVELHDHPVSDGAIASESPPIAADTAGRRSAPTLPNAVSHAAQRHSQGARSGATRLYGRPDTLLYRTRYRFARLVLAPLPTSAYVLPNCHVTRCRPNVTPSSSALLRAAICTKLPTVLSSLAAFGTPRWHPLCAFLLLAAIYALVPTDSVFCNGPPALSAPRTSRRATSATASREHG